jgi:hypothetical protein
MARRRPGDSADLEAVIEALNAYSDAFGRGSLDDVAGYCRAPMTLVAPEGTRLLASEEDIRAAYDATLRELRARGYSHTVWAELNVRLLSDATALASGIPVRFLADGRELERVAATYLLHNTAGAWRIMVVVLHDAATVLPLE